MPLVISLSPRANIVLRVSSSSLIPISLARERGAPISAKPNPILNHPRPLARRWALLSISADGWSVYRRRYRRPCSIAAVIFPLLIPHRESKPDRGGERSDRRGWVLWRRLTTGDQISPQRDTGRISSTATSVYLTRAAEVDSDSGGEQARSVTLITPKCRNRGATLRWSLHQPQRCERLRIRPRTVVISPSGGKGFCKKGAEVRGEPRRNMSFTS